MLALFETPAGYALFQVQNPKALKDVDNIHTHFKTAEGAKKLYVSLGGDFCHGRGLVCLYKGISCNMFRF